MKFSKFLINKRNLWELGAIIGMEGFCFGIHLGRTLILQIVRPFVTHQLIVLEKQCSYIEIDEVFLYYSRLITLKFWSFIDLYQIYTICLSYYWIVF